MDVRHVGLVDKLIHIHIHITTSTSLPMWLEASIARNIVNVAVVDAADAVDRRAVAGTDGGAAAVTVIRLVERYWTWMSMIRTVTRRWPIERLWCWSTADDVQQEAMVRVLAE